MSIKESKYNEGIELKEEGSSTFVEGFISAPGFDLEGDRMMNQQGIVDQINDKTEAQQGSLHHDRSGTSLLHGEHAELKDGKAWVKSKLNSDHPDFHKTCREIEGKFINGFSVEFLPIEDVGVEGTDYTYNGKELGDHRGRDIMNPTVVGYGLASRGIHPDATITNFYAKEFMNIPIEGNEVKQMKEKIEKKEETPVEEPKNTDNTPEAPAAEEPAKEEPAAEEAKEDEKPTEEKEGVKTEMKEAIQNVLKTELKEYMKTQSPTNVAPAAPVEIKELTAYKEAFNMEVKGEDSFARGDSAANKLAFQYKAANDILNANPEIYANGAKSAEDMISETKESQYWSCVGNQITVKSGASLPIEGKALTAYNSPTNDETTYFQAPAELGDVYDPVIVSQLNDATTTYGILPKEDKSGFQAIQFRAVDAAGITAAGYNEGDTTWTVSNHSLKKFEQDFAYYRSIIEVTDQMMISARAASGIGDVFGMEVQRATTELLKTINTDILTGAGGTYDGTDSQYLIGFQHLILDTGNLYGKARSSIATLRGTDEAMSSAELSLDQLRKMKRTVLKNGARLQDLVFITSYLQADKYRALMQSAQRIVPTSSRFGFEGRPEFDGIPIFEDQHADDDDVFLVDLSATRIAIQRPPSVIEFGRTGDTRKAAIVMYFNVYSTNPNWNYWSSGFSTS